MQRPYWSPWGPMEPSLLQNIGIRIGMGTVKGIKREGDGAAPPPYFMSYK